ncbi:hypothetical protein [Nitrosopumilus sp.]|uniref:hypothetical protein n=1 Tax=Nitrosopumilus sp. TaxID=2024843 RepID=UPI00292CFC95|nr:hypothetical protein [Nitrosopumilus sp.]
MKQKSIFALVLGAILVLTVSSTDAAFADYDRYDDDYDDSYEKEYDREDDRDDDDYDDDRDDDDKSEREERRS